MQDRIGERRMSGSTKERGEDDLPEDEVLDRMEKGIRQIGRAHV